MADNGHNGGNKSVQVAETVNPSTAVKPALKEENKGQPGVTAISRRPSRRSPTTGHRRKKTDALKQRSQSSPRVATSTIPTSSDDDGPERRIIQPRRKSMSPPPGSQDVGIPQSAEPKKVLRRRHRLKEKLPATAANTDTGKDAPIIPTTNERIQQKTPSVKPSSTSKTHQISKPTKEMTEDNIDLRQSTGDIKSIEQVEQKSLTDTDNTRSQQAEKKEEIETANEGETKNDAEKTVKLEKTPKQNKWWGNWSFFRNKEQDDEHREIVSDEKTSDDVQNSYKFEDYMTSDDDLAKEFVRIVAQTNIKQNKDSKQGHSDRRSSCTVTPEVIQQQISSQVEKAIWTDEKREPTVKTWVTLFRESRVEFSKFRKEFPHEMETLRKLRNRCACELVLMFIICGCGAFVFKTTEGAFEAYYKCGVKRVKRDFVEELWRSSHFMPEDEWKSKARRKLWEFETQLHEAFEAGLTTYSGQRSWSFINGIIYCLTIVTTIGYGHIAPVTNSGRALTIAYSIIGIPLFLILLADFGKLFTRGIKFLWAFVRRVYYTGSCRKVRRTAPVQEVIKGVQLVYETIRRPSMFPQEGANDLSRGRTAGDTVGTPGEAPSTPALSAFAIDDEFNLPISVAISILLVYIFLGATVFWIWEEEWTFFESFYFVFISMSTIGFGDLVPKNQMYMMASIVYLAFGLALTSMCINVVQEKLSDSFRKASTKIGATIGLKVSDDDGTISPVSPTQVEIAQVHGFAAPPVLSSPSHISPS